MNFSWIKSTYKRLTGISAYILAFFILSLLLSKYSVFAQTDSFKVPSLITASQPINSKALQGGSTASVQKLNRQDISRAIQYSNTHSRKNLPPVLPKSRPKPSISPTQLPVNQYFVQPVLFIASDQTDSVSYTGGINDTFQMLQRWYSGALEQNNTGYTFRVSGVTEFRAAQPFSYYKCPNHETSCDNYDGIWGNVQTELENAGYPLWSAGESFVIFVKGAGGWAGSGCGPNCLTSWPTPGPASQDGVAILGDWALDAISGTLNTDCFAQMGSACYRDPQRGAVGHELGHTFGLAHALDQTGSIMYSWWDFPDTSLFAVSGNDEKDVLRADSKFFQTISCTLDDRVDRTDMPTTVKTKTQFPVSFTLTNYGYCHWALSTTILHIIQDDVWGLQSAQLGQDVFPAQQIIFSLVLTSPSLKGNAPSHTYLNMWQLQNNGKYFGPQMGSQITVTR